jgi:hypothetical protein
VPGRRVREYEEPRDEGPAHDMSVREQSSRGWLRRRAVAMRRHPVGAAAGVLCIAVVVIACGSASHHDVASAAVIDRGPAAVLPKPLSCLTSSSSAVAPKPSGLIALQGSSTITPSSSVVPAAVLRDGLISGVQIYLEWSALEPQRGQFSTPVFHALDQVFCEAQSHHDFVVLDVLPGFDSPAWALGVTVPAPCKKPGYQTGSSFAFCFAYSYAGKLPPRALAVPWNATYLSNWFAFLMVIAARYGSNPAFSMVAAAGPTSVSEEMSLPPCPCVDQETDPGLPATYPPNGGKAIDGSDLNMWTALGYTPSIYETAWQTVFATYARLFPRQYISFSLFTGLPLPDVSAESTTLESVFDVGKQTVGPSRFAFQGDGVVPNESTNPATHYNYVKVQDGTIAATGFQTPNPGSLDPGFPTPEVALEGALDSGVAARVNYLEIYDTDLIDPSTQKIIPAMQAVLKAVRSHWPITVPPTVPPKAPPKPCGTKCQ